MRGKPARTVLRGPHCRQAAGLPNHPLPQLLHGQEQRVYGDSAYASQKALIRGKAPKARDFTNQRTRRAGEVDEVARGKNRNKSKIRASVEHVFAVVKRLWGFTKVRYRGLAKNANRAFVALALANVYLSRRRLMAQVRPLWAKSGPKARANGPKGPKTRGQSSAHGDQTSNHFEIEICGGLFSVALNE
ncbi:hypothetical protein OKW43_000101 [Paraburkholderia sp. WC7.3g]